MLDLDLSDTARPTREARGLPNLCYIDQGYFAFERERVFAPGWTCAGVGADVPNIGDYRPIELLGLPLLITRGRNARVRVFHNVCSHRGVKLVTEVGNGQRLLCPYHAWSYDLTGRLVRTPDVGGPGIHEVDGIDPAALGLREVRTGQWLDFVFVNLSGTAGPLGEWLAPLQQMWSHYPLDLLRHGGAADFLVRANWKLATENSMEYYHLPPVHRALNSYSPADAHYHCNAGGRFLGTATRDYNPAMACGQDLPRFEGLSAEAERVGEYPMVFPNLWLGVHVDHLYAVVVYPTSIDRTAQRLHLYFVGEAALAPRYAAARQEVLDRWRSINAEDIAVTELMQQGRQSPAFDGGRLSPVQDAAIHHFMKMVAERLQSGGAAG